MIGSFAPGTRHCPVSRWNLETLTRPQAQGTWGRAATLLLTKAVGLPKAQFTCLQNGHRPTLCEAETEQCV